MTKLTYRVGTLEDIPGLILFLINFKEENPLMDQFEYDVKGSAETLRRIIQEDQGVILVALNDDIIVGTIVLGKTKLWWAHKEIFTDLVFYVNPEYRKGEVPKKLFEYVKVFADDLKMPIMLSIVKDSTNNELLERYLNIKGFKSVGFRALYTPKE